MLVKRAELQVFDRLDSGRAGWEEEATEIVRLRAKKQKLEFDDDALDLFVLLTGGDTRQIENELEKIDIYCSAGVGPVERAGVSPAEPKPRGSPPRVRPVADRAPAGPTGRMVVPRITVDLVRELVPLSRAGIIFELSNALAVRDLELALTLVRRLLDQGEKAIGILLVAIVPTVRNLLLAKDLKDRHGLPRPHSPFQFISAINRLPAKATEHLPRKKDGSINAYALGIAAQHADHFETNQLINAMRACLNANVQLVTTQLDHELILTEVVVKLLAEKGRGD
jgi:DNA polymerase-3 subunit delta